MIKKTCRHCSTHSFWTNHWFRPVGWCPAAISSARSGGAWNLPVVMDDRDNTYWNLWWLGRDPPLWKPPYGWIMLKIELCTVSTMMICRWWCRQERNVCILRMFKRQCLRSLTIQQLEENGQNFGWRVSWMWQTLISVGGLYLFGTFWRTIRTMAPGIRPHGSWSLGVVDLIPINVCLPGGLVGFMVVLRRIVT